MSKFTTGGKFRYEYEYSDSQRTTGQNKRLRNLEDLTHEITTFAEDQRTFEIEAMSSEGKNCRSRRQGDQNIFNLDKHLTMGLKNT